MENLPIGRSPPKMHDDLDEGVRRRQQHSGSDDRIAEGGRRVSACVSTGSWN